MKYVKFFLVFIAVVSMTGCVTLPPLMDAADKGDINAVNALLDKGADVNEWRYGTALMTASYRENTDMVKLLIDRGADVNAMNKGGHSALGIAAEWGNADIVEILIAKGADIDKAITGLNQRAAFLAEPPAVPQQVVKVQNGINLIKAKQKSLPTKAGWAYYSKGQYQEAINSFEKAIRLDPSISSNFRGLSSAHTALKQYDQAITALKRAIALKPGNALAYNNLGWAYGNMKQYAKMSEAYKKAIELNPKDATYYGNLGWFLLLDSEYKEAAIYLKKAVELAPNNKTFLSVLYIPYYLQGRYEDALAAVNKSIGLTAFAGIGAQVQIMNNFPVIKGVIQSSPAKTADIQPGDQIINIDGKSTENLNIEAIVQKVRGQEGTQVTLMIKRQDVKEPLKKTVTRERQYAPRVLTNIGYRSLIFRQMGRQEEALKDAITASAAENSAPARIALGAAYVDKGDYNKAIKSLSQVKDKPAARILEATAYAKKGDFKRAVDIYSSIPEEELSQKNVPLWSDRTSLLKTLKPFIASKMESADRLKAQGRYKEALNELGEVMKVADDKTSKKICGSIYRIMSMDPRLSELPEEARKYALRGDVLTEEGKFGEAVKEYRQAVQAAPYIAKLYFNTAMIYGELKRYSQAIRNMKTYLQLAPEAPNVRAAKDQIYKWEFKMEKGG